MIIQWCSFCNENPADGVVKGKFDDEPEPQELPACLECVKKMNW